MSLLFVSNLRGVWCEQRLQVKYIFEGSKNDTCDGCDVTAVADRKTLGCRFILFR